MDGSNSEVSPERRLLRRRCPPLTRWAHGGEGRRGGEREGCLGSEGRSGRVLLASPTYSGLELVRFSFSSGGGVATTAACSCLSVGKPVWGGRFRRACGAFSGFGGKWVEVVGWWLGPGPWGVPG